MDFWLILLIFVITFLIIVIFYKYTYNKGFDNGFRYGYENNPISNNNHDEIKKATNLLRSITLYKNNKQVVNKAIHILDGLNDVSNVSVEEKKNIKFSVKYLFLNIRNKIIRFISIFQRKL